MKHRIAFYSVLLLLSGCGAIDKFAERSITTLKLDMDRTADGKQMHAEETLHGNTRSVHAAFKDGVEFIINRVMERK